MRYSLDCITISTATFPTLYACAYGVNNVYPFNVTLLMLNCVLPPPRLKLKVPLGAVTFDPLSPLTSTLAPFKGEPVRLYDVPCERTYPFCICADAVMHDINNANNTDNIFFMYCLVLIL